MILPDLIKMVESPVDEKQTKAYIRAFFDSMRQSVSHNEPVHIKGLFDINIDKYLFKKLMMGENLPMPDGVRQAIRDAERGAYNSRRSVGSFLQWKGNIGVVIRKVGDDKLLVKPLIRFEPYKIGKYERLKWSESNEKPILLTPSDYKSTGSVKRWLQLSIRKIDPVISVDGMMRKLRSLRDGK